MDMGWQKFAAGRSYNSPSGVLHLVGGELEKVIASFVYRNSCNVCSELHELVKKGETK